MAGKIEISAEEAMKAVDWRMPIYNRVCSECGALCFDDDSFCAECGVKFKESVVSEKKYIVPFEKSDTVDIHDLYDIINQATGLNQNEIFEAIYTEQ